MGRRTRGLIAALASTVLGASFAAALTTPAAAEDGYTSWDLRSEPMDPIGRGDSYSYSLRSSEIAAEGDSQLVPTTTSLTPLARRCSSVKVRSTVR